MKITRIVALSLAASVFSLTGVHAQTTANTAVPAEFPPASFTGKQYVDSNGCIFIRAGVSGNVTWVPRVGRDRKQICGYQPSAQTNSDAAVPTPRAAAPAPVEIVPDAVPGVVATAPAAPAAAPSAVVTPVVTASTAAPVAAPKTVKARPVVVPASPGRNTTGYIKAINASTGETVLLPPDTRVVPRHVYENRRDSRNLKVPKGYRAGWRDDRLNPYRAEQTLRGRAQMNMVWTNTVPRRLVAAGTENTASDVPVVYETETRRINQVTMAVSTQSNAVVQKTVPGSVKRSGKADNLR